MLGNEMQKQIKQQEMWSHGGKNAGRELGTDRTGRKLRRSDLLPQTRGNMWRTGWRRSSS